MDRRTAIEWLEQIKHSIRGGDEEFDRQRKESLDMAITDMKICEANNAGWISVKDRMPGNNKDVLIYGEWTGISRTKYRELFLSGMEDFIYQGYKPIAWMPLPEPPKEE